jgi:hypothetical protein
MNELNILNGLAGNRTPDHSHAKGAERQLVRTHVLLLMIEMGCSLLYH